VSERKGLYVRATQKGYKKQKVKHGKRRNKREG